MDLDAFSSDAAADLAVDLAVPLRPSVLPPARWVPLEAGPLGGETAGRLAELVMMLAYRAAFPRGAPGRTLFLDNELVNDPEAGKTLQQFFRIAPAVAREIACTCSLENFARDPNRRTAVGLHWSEPLRKQPDILDLERGQLYEIKPDNGRGARDARIKLAIYGCTIECVRTNAARLGLAPFRKVVRGVEFARPRSIVLFEGIPKKLPALKLATRLAAPGMLLYGWSMAPNGLDAKLATDQAIRLLFVHHARLKWLRRRRGLSSSDAERIGAAVVRKVLAGAARARRLGPPSPGPLATFRRLWPWGGHRFAGDGDGSGGDLLGL